MSASLVGSEMCIRDRCAALSPAVLRGGCAGFGPPLLLAGGLVAIGLSGCLLYTSDAADDM
eukprot:13402169-Alexandrium_andersonii.AAC.1